MALVPAAAAAAEVTTVAAAEVTTTVVAEDHLILEVYLTDLLLQVMQA